jgi:hypothetical protein
VPLEGEGRGVDEDKQQEDYFDYRSAGRVSLHGVHFSSRGFGMKGSSEVVVATGAPGTLLETLNRASILRTAEVRIAGICYVSSTPNEIGVWELTA